MQSIIDLQRLDAAKNRFGDILIDPTIWPEVLEQIAAAAGATGAVLLQAGVGTFAYRTESISEAVDHYFSHGFNTRDIRARQGVPLLRRGRRVIIDQDFFTPEQIRRDPVYNECLFPYGLGWFAALGAPVGSSLWGIMIQRTSNEGPFDSANKRVLARLRRPLIELALISNAVGRITLTSATNALQQVGLAAVAVDRQGIVLGANARVDDLFDDEMYIKCKRLRVSDIEAQKRIDNIIDRLLVANDREDFFAEAIPVRRQKKNPVIIRVLPVPRAARTPFLDACALFTFTPLEPRSDHHPTALIDVFELTPAEASLASIIAEGASPEEAAKRLGVAKETARNQLKAVFGKTGTHRQSELVALLARL